MGCCQSSGTTATSMKSMKYINENKLDNAAVSDTNGENLQDARQKTEPTATETNRLSTQQEQVSRRSTGYDTVAMTEPTNPHGKDNQRNQHAQSNMQDAATGQLSGRDAPAGSHKSGMETSGSRPQQQHNTNNKKEEELKQSRQREHEYEKLLKQMDRHDLIKRCRKAESIVNQLSREKQITMQENFDLKKRCSEAETRVSTLSSKIREMEQEKNYLKKRYEDVAAQLITSKNELDTLKVQVKQNHKKFEQIKSESEKEKRQLQSENDTNVKILKKKAAELQQEISELKQANDELKTRLSAVFGAKLQDNNPNIADLSDMNRPTKLAERFSELYDNEWTNCFEVLHNQHGIGEKETIEQILQVCLTIYEECRLNASNDLKELAQALNRSDTETDIRFVKDLKDLKEKRKRRFQDDIKRLRQPIEEKVSRIFKERTNETKISEFWTKCLEICWLMAIQDPPVSMDTSTGRLGEIFIATSYRPYTKAGKFVEFIVWPALRLTDDGSLLYKGVAQGTETYQQFSDLVDTVSNESHTSLNEKTGSKVDAMKRNENKSQICMGDNVLENKGEQYNGKSQKPAEQRTGKLVRLTDDSKMSQNEHTGNSECDVPTQETNNSNTLDTKQNVDTDGNTPVNVDSLYKNTQPEERNSKESSDIHNHNTSTQSDKTDGTRAKQDKPQPNKIHTTAGTGMAQHDNENPTQVNASRRKSSTGENSQMSESIQNKANVFGQSLKMKSAPAAPSSEHLSAEKKNMIQTESSNIQQERKAQSVKGTTHSATVVKHNTSIQVGSVRMKGIPVDKTQLK